jgi:hypothetical protein
MLPQTANWPSFPPQQYLLTLGFKNKEDGKFLEKASSRKLPTYIGESLGLNIIFHCDYKSWDYALFVRSYSSQGPACSKA